MKEQILKLLAEGDKTHKAMQKAIGCKSKDLSNAIQMLKAQRKIFVIRQTNAGWEYGLKKNSSPSARCLEALTTSMKTAEIAKIAGLSEDGTRIIMTRLESEGLVKRSQKDRFTVWTLVHKPTDDFIPEFDEDLKVNLAQQWRGTPWQGMESVL